MFEELSSIARLILLVAGISCLWGLRSLVIHQQASSNDDNDRSNKTISKVPTESTISPVSAALIAQLPNSAFLPGSPQFAACVDSYWANQQRETVPASVVRPRDASEAATAVSIIKQEFDRRLKEKAIPSSSSSLSSSPPLPTFAIRSGGHSAMPGFSTVAGGTVIDLTLLNHVEPSDDRASVLIGSGARWRDVSLKLDPLGIAVAGGRNSDVGVGGLTLGGGYSFFSPRVGFVCDNVLEYQVVLASGEITVASETRNPRLWRVLKGGGNNFCLVTSFRMRAFSCTSIWGGFLYMFSSKAPQAIQALHNSVKAFDEYAAGPIVCVSYIQKIGLQIVSTHVMYTKPEPWPPFWQEFESIGRIWSTTKVRTLTSATGELDGVSPGKLRQLHISTVIKNDLKTMEFAHATFQEKISSLKQVKGMVWTVVFQPVHSSTMKKGKENVLGLSDRQDDLIVTLFTAVWERASDDALVNTVAKTGMAAIEKYASDKGTADRFRLS